MLAHCTQAAEVCFEIPALSASVNVSMAFMAALTALKIADAKFIDAE